MNKGAMIALVGAAIVGLILVFSKSTSASTLVAGTPAVTPANAALTTAQLNAASSTLGALANLFSTPAVTSVAGATGGYSAANAAGLTPAQLTAVTTQPITVASEAPVVSNDLFAEGGGLDSIGTDDPSVISAASIDVGQSVDVTSAPSDIDLTNFGSDDSGDEGDD